MVWHNLFWIPYAWIHLLSLPQSKFRSLLIILPTTDLYTTCTLMRKWWCKYSMQALLSFFFHWIYEGKMVWHNLFWIPYAWKHLLSLPQSYITSIHSLIYKITLITGLINKINALIDSINDRIQTNISHWSIWECSMVINRDAVLLFENASR